MTIDDLKAYGADVDTAIKRCAGMESLYLNLVKKIPEMEEFEKLNQSVNAGNLEEAFSYAHGLKGNVANLSLTPLEKPISEITELLRERQAIDYSSYLEEINQCLQKLKEILA